MIIFVLLGGYATPYRLDRNSNRGGILVFIGKNMPSTMFYFSETGFEGFFLEPNVRKNKWLVFFFSNAYKKKMSNHLS